ncbi:MAG: hypothetical protein LBT59_19635 [Clostridiales bacterium]|nr:hypothetical protein [Clostridiales bacterium]
MKEKAPATATNLSGSLELHENLTSDKNVEPFADLVLSKTKGKNMAQAQTRAERCLLVSLLYYLYYEASADELNWTVAAMLLEDAESGTSYFSYSGLVDLLSDKDENHDALKWHKKFLDASDGEEGMVAQALCQRLADNPEISQDIRDNQQAMDEKYEAADAKQTGKPVAPIEATVAKSEQYMADLRQLGEAEAEYLEKYYVNSLTKAKSDEKEEKAQVYEILKTIGDEAERERLKKDYIDNYMQLKMGYVISVSNIYRNTLKTGKVNPDKIESGAASLMNASPQVIASSQEGKGSFYWQFIDRAAEQHKNLKHLGDNMEKLKALWVMADCRSYADINLLDELCDALFVIMKTDYGKLYKLPKDADMIARTEACKAFNNAFGSGDGQDYSHWAIHVCFYNGQSFTQSNSLIPFEKNDIIEFIKQFGAISVFGKRKHINKNLADAFIKNSNAEAEKFKREYTIAFYEVWYCHNKKCPDYLRLSIELDKLKANNSGINDDDVNMTKLLNDVLSIKDVPSEFLLVKEAKEDYLLKAFKEAKVSDVSQLRSAIDHAKRFKEEALEKARKKIKMLKRTCDSCGYWIPDPKSPTGVACSAKFFEALYYGKQACDKYK